MTFTQSDLSVKTCNEKSEDKKKDDLVHCKWRRLAWMLGKTVMTVMVM